MLKVQALSARSEWELLADLTFNVDNGEVVAVIGNHRSGKKLLGQVVSGLAPATSGNVTINHYRLDRQGERARSQIGYLPNPIFLPPFLSAFEYLELVSSSYRMPPESRLSKIRGLIGQLDFNQDAYTPLERVDPTILKKVALAAALVHQPSLLVLDEPLNDLDYPARRQATELIKAAVKDGASLLLITDDLDLAESWADRYLAINSGGVVAEGTLKQLANQTRAKSGRLTDIYQALLA